VSFCECGDESSGSINAGKLSSGCRTGGFLSSAQVHRGSRSDSQSVSQTVSQSGSHSVSKSVSRKKK
jgi:hypothetical protein